MTNVEPIVPALNLSEEIEQYHQYVAIQQLRIFDFVTWFEHTHGYTPNLASA
jgi:hypothetical protein